MIFPLIAGFLRMAHIAPSATNHLPTPRPAAPTARPAPTTIPIVARDWSIPMICNDTIRPYIADASVNAIPSMVMIKNVPVRFGFFPIRARAFFAIIPSPRPAPKPAIPIANPAPMPAYNVIASHCAPKSINATTKP